MKISKNMIFRTVKKITILATVLFGLFLFFAPQSTAAYSFTALPGHDYTSLNLDCNTTADCTKYYKLSCDATDQFCYLNKESWTGSPAAKIPANLECYYNNGPAIALCGEIQCNITNPSANPKGDCLYGQPNAEGTRIIKAGFVQGTPEPEKKFTLLDPLSNLQIKIPGLEKIASETPATCTTEGDQTSCSLPWIAVYIKAIYNYAMGIIGILAALALMIGGVIYLTATGNATRISEAKSWITGALTGMLIMFTSYILLNEINPDLVGLKPIELSIVEPQEDYTVQENVSSLPPGTIDENGWATIPVDSNIIDKTDGDRASQATIEKLLIANECMRQAGYKIRITSASRTPENQAETFKKNCGGKTTCADKKCSTPTCCPFPLDAQSSSRCPHTSGVAFDAWGWDPNSKITKNRSQASQYKLQDCMIQAGFCLLSNECWHFEFPHFSGKCKNNTEPHNLAGTYCADIK
jgi:hypothetical protein